MLARQGFLHRRDNQGELRADLGQRLGLALVDLEQAAIGGHPPMLEAQERITNVIGALPLVLLETGEGQTVLHHTNGL